MKVFKTLLVLTLLLGDFGTPPTSAKELYVICTKGNFYAVVHDWGD